MIEVFCLAKNMHCQAGPPVVWRDSDSNSQLDFFFSCTEKKNLLVPGFELRWV